MKKCGCKSCGDGSIELCEFHDFVHKHGGMDSCRRCASDIPADMLTEGLCDECMKQAGLVRCDICGRAVAKSISETRNQAVWCKPCIREVGRAIH